jgi:hypothetical protein
MSILLETQKYNHYKLLKEDYHPRLIEYAITKSGNFMIIENELFDIKLNKSLGFYYESKLLKEDIIKEDWLETIADIAVAGTSAALDVTGIGTGAAKAIDFAHALSFIYRGETRNDLVLKMMGFFSLGTLAIPAVGSSVKGVITAIAKNFIGKPIGKLITALSKNSLTLKLLPKFKSGISTLGGLVKQFNGWAKKYPFFNKVWEPLGKLFNKGLDDFAKFLDDVIAAATKSGAKAGTKAGQKAVGAGAKTGQKALTAGTKGISSLKGLGVTDDGIKAIEQIMKNGQTIKPDQLNKLISNAKDIPMLKTVINKYGTKQIEVLDSALGTIFANNSPLLTKMAASNVKAVNSLVQSGNKLLLPASTKVAQQTSGAIVKSSSGAQMVKVLEISGPKVTEKIVKPSFLQKVKAFKIPSEYKVAASVLIGMGLGGVLFGGDTTAKNYVLADDEINKTLSNSGVEVKQPTQTTQTTTTKDDLEGKVIDNHDKSWDYMKKGGKYYTRRKGKTNWIHVTPEMKGGKPLKAIRTKVYGETV